MASRELAVDTLNRDEVVAFWHAVHQASEGYQTRVGWTGTFPNDPGTTSAAFVGDVERRINYFRAMSGVPASVRVNSGSQVVIKGADRFKPAPNLMKSAACQSAAMMLVASYDPKIGTVSGMSHDPDPGVPKWSPAAWNAAANSNLAFGTFGPGSINEYVVEELLAKTVTSEWNVLVGHRRWLLTSDSTDFASGDYPGESAFHPPTNVLYVVQRSEEVAPLPESPFVSYPPKGFFPSSLNGRFWSLSRKGADFSAATVQITDAAGAKVPILAVRKDSSYGEPAIIWQVGGAAAERSVTADRRFRVSVQGIQGVGVPSDYQYDVTLISPALLRRVSPISGPGKAKPGSKVKLQIKPIAGARKSRVVHYQRAGKRWVEGGEGLKPDVIDRTSPIYPLLATSAGAVGAGAITGSKSFNLTFPQIYDLIARGVPQQIMELGPWIYTKTGSTLEFQYRRGLMSDATHMVVEVSGDQGNTWKGVGKPIKGYAEAKPDMETFRATYKLPKSKKPLRVRFRYFYAVNGGPLTSHLDQPGFPTGIFLDEIKLVNCERLIPKKTQNVKRASFVFRVPKKAKPQVRWAFGLESEFGGPWLQTGPFKMVRVVK
jgi:hypothetical protein